MSVRARDLVDQSKSTDKRLRANFPQETESYPQFFFSKEVGKIFLSSDYKTLYNTFINVSCIDRLQEESARDNRKEIEAIHQRYLPLVQESRKRSDVRKGKKEQWSTQSTNRARSTSYSMDWKRIGRITRNI